jgi:hypothetical protein
MIIESDIFALQLPTNDHSVAMNVTIKHQRLLFIGLWIPLFQTEAKVLES